MLQMFVVEDNDDFSKTVLCLLAFDDEFLSSVAAAAGEVVLQNSP